MYRFVLHPRNLRVPPQKPQWLRALADPPPKLDDDEWELIEHVRLTGQLESGAITWRDSWFGPPVHLEQSWRNWDKNAPERIEADKLAEQRRIDLGREIEAIRARVAVTKAEREQRKRDQQQQFFEYKRFEAEEQRLRRAREEEARRRDEEWEAATLEALASQADVYFKNVYRTDANRKAMIRAIVKQFPHWNLAIVNQVSNEFCDIDWVEQRSRERNNMSVYELLWRRTRFLAGFR